MRDRSDKVSLWMGRVSFWISTEKRVEVKRSLDFVA